MKKIKLAVWKFSSCDGCQLSILDCEDELLEIAASVEIAYFPEATRASSPGPYDLSLVEGSISTPDEAVRIQKIRRQSKVLVALGACATDGGIQGLRNFANAGEWAAKVYEHPEWLEFLEKLTPLHHHIFVDYELRGCPVSKAQLVEVLSALIAGRKPFLPSGSVCHECKMRGTSCLMVAQGIPCLGPVTHAGCGALCPSLGRGCYGCFGASVGANVEAMRTELDRLKVSKRDQVRLLRQITSNAEPFRNAANAILETQR